MKKALLLTGVLLALTASLASAAGLNLGWQGGTAASACPTNVGALVDMVDPCDDTGFNMMVGSARPGVNLATVTGEEIYVDMQTASATLPDFWHIEIGGCDPEVDVLLMEAVFTGFTTGTATTACSNYWGTAASGGFNWAPGVGGANRARLSGVFARTPASASNMTGTRQYYIFRASMSTNHATICAGCDIPACWVFNRLLLTQPVGMGDLDLSGADVRNFVTWYGGHGVEPGGCPTATPASRATWGQVKSLYR